MAENEHPDHLMCPFCGKGDIKYGAIVCGGCQAEISYSRPWLKTLLISILWLFFGGAFTKDSGTLFYIVLGIGVLGIIGYIFMARDHSPQFHRIMKHVK